MPAIQPLKSMLMELMLNDWAFPDDMDAPDLADKLLEALASTDSMLRDRLALTGLCSLIESGLLEDEQCRALFGKVISDKHLLCGLGREEDDSVFNRAFSVLVVGAVLAYNRDLDRMLLADSEVKKAFDAMLRCLEEERDLRDLDNSKGWAHCVAHVGDVLADFVENESIGPNDVAKLLCVIKGKICVDHHCYRSNEEVRLAAVVFRLLERNLIEQNAFSAWVADFFSCGETGNAGKDGCLLHNRYHFFLSMRRKLEAEYPSLHPFVKSAILELMKV